MPVLPPCDAIRSDFEIIPSSKLHDNFMKDFLAEYIADLAKLSKEEGFHFFPRIEHPTIAATLVALADRRGARSILEIGYECGVAAAPLAMYAMMKDGGYIGQDAYAHSWEAGERQTDFLKIYLRDVSEAMQVLGIVVQGHVAFEGGEPFEPKSDWPKFDFVFVDHHKPLYLDAIRGLLDNNLLADGAWLVCHDTYSYQADAWDPIREFIADHNLGETHDLADGFQGIHAYDAGIITLKKGFQWPVKE